MTIRKSLEDIAHMVRKVTYKGELPSELKPLHYYISDSGHCIMCILDMHIDMALKDDPDDYEIPIPVKYVLAKGYKIAQGRVVVDAEYSSEYGLMVGDEYYEY